MINTLTKLFRTTGILFAFLLSAGSPAQTEVQLAGKLAAQYPFFRWVQNFNRDQALNMAIDGKLFPAVAGATANVYVVTDRSASEWQLNNTLTNVTAGGAQSFLFSGDSIQQNIFQLAAPNELVAYTTVEIGVGYDIVIDMDGDGLLSSADLIDGGEGAGFYMIHDISQPGALAIVTQDWTDSLQLTKRIWYPANIASLDSLPLIVISHGWTYNYTLYDYIGEHLASYGYIVMSHWNDVGNGDQFGTLSAANSLIANVDHLIANQSTLFGGVLNGKINHHRMGWMGHSTGGESVVCAYTHLHDGISTASYFNWQDVSYISSFCPVAWCSSVDVHPHDVNYHQFLGGADNDVSGAALNTYTQPLMIYERGTGNKHVVYVHGAGHGVFNTDTTGEQYVQGPDLINRAQLHPLVKAYLIAMSDLYCKQNPAGKEFFTRNYSEYHPMNADPAVIITNEYHDGQSAYRKVIDNFESNATLTLASSGAGVTSNLSNSSEILMKDVSGSFTWSASQPANGMTRARYANDKPHCLVMEWNNPGFVRYTIPDTIKDFSGYEYLSFRACQRTQHPFNVALDSSANFYVTLVDESGDSASIQIEPYGPVIQTYQRNGGWQNEFCIMRMRLSEFLVNGSQVDLNAIENIVFDFGRTGASQQGALGIDDIELVNQGVNFPVQLRQLSRSSDLLIYPNPASGVFTVSFPVSIGKGKLEMYSIAGVKVHTEAISNESKKEIRLKGIAPGMYLVKLVEGERSYSTKIIIE
jgi:hypothetical protein